MVVAVLRVARAVAMVARVVARSEAVGVLAWVRTAARAPSA